MTPGDFSKYYQTLSDAELLSILANMGDYQPAAIEAAVGEAARRKLTEKDVDEMRQSLAIKKTQRLIPNVLEEKIQKVKQNIADTFNPLREEKLSTDAVIRYIAIFYAAVALYLLIQDRQLLSIMIKNFSRDPFEMIFFYMPYILLPVAVFFFWKKRSIGWTLLAIFLVYTVMPILFILITSILENPSHHKNDIIYFPGPSLFTTILQLVFWGSGLYGICRNSIRRVFRIDGQKAFITILLTAVISFFAILSVV